VSVCVLTLQQWLFKCEHLSLKLNGKSVLTKMSSHVIILSDYKGKHYPLEEIKV